MLFKNKYVQINSAIIKDKNLAFPDYYVRNGSKVFLFENKYIKLSDKSKLSYDYIKFKNEIKEKLFITSSGKKKGVLQLMNCVKNSSNGKYAPYDKCRIKSKKYYPILIVEDHSLCTFGINTLLNNWMRDYISENEEVYKGLIIKDVTVINIDDLLYYNSFLSKLSSIIDDYHKFGKSKNENVGISFSDYLTMFKIPRGYSVNKKEINSILTEPFHFYDD